MALGECAMLVIAAGVTLGIIAADAVLRFPAGHLAAYGHVGARSLMVAFQ